MRTLNLADIEGSKLAETMGWKVTDKFFLWLEYDRHVL